MTQQRQADQHERPARRLVVPLSQPCASEPARTPAALANF